MKQQWRGSDLTAQLIFSTGPAPLRNIADTDDALVVTFKNPRAMEPKNDLNGVGGVHVINEETNISIQIRFEVGATASIAFLNNMLLQKIQARAFTAQNQGSNFARVVAENVVVEDSGPWGGGKNPSQIQFMLSAIRGTITYGGQRDI